MRSGLVSSVRDMSLGDPPRTGAQSVCHLLVTWSDGKTLGSVKLSDTKTIESGEGSTNGQQVHCNVALPSQPVS